MKLLIVTRSFDQNIGGMERHTRVLVEYLLGKGWDIDIITPNLPASSEPHFTVKGVTIKRLGNAPNELIKQSVSFWSATRKYLLRFAGQYDAILNIGMAMALARGLPKTTREKVVTILHGTYRFERKTFYTSLKTNGFDPKTLFGIPYSYVFDGIQRTVIRRSALVVAISRGIRDDLINSYGLQEQKSRLIANFVDTQMYTPARKHTSKEVEIVFLSRIHKEKGLFKLLEALDLLQSSLKGSGMQFHCSIYGSGPDARQAAKMIKELDLQKYVTLKGAATHEEVPTILKNADIYALPSLRSEGLPIALLEAMSTELACVVSDTEGNNELIQHEVTGLLVKKGDASDLAEKLEKLVRDGKLRRKLGSAAREEVEQEYEVHSSLAAFDTVLKSVTPHKG